MDSAFKFFDSLCFCHFFSGAGVDGEPDDVTFTRFGGSTGLHPMPRIGASTPGFFSFSISALAAFNPASSKSSRRKSPSLVGMGSIQYGLYVVQKTHADFRFS